MKKFKKISIFNTITCLLVWVIILSGFSNSIDTSRPEGTDDPSEADNNMRRVQAGIQERHNVDHVWALDGTTVDASDTGEHRKITYNVSISAPTQVASKAHLYMNSDELYYQDDTNTTLQITDSGKLNGENMDAIKANSGTTNTVATFRSSDTQASIALADDSTSGGNIPILLRVANALFINHSKGDTTIGNASSDVFLSKATGSSDRSIADKAYVDDSFPDDDAFGTWSVESASTTSYTAQAATDGIVTAFGATTQGHIDGFTDSNASPTTQKTAAVHAGGSFGSHEIGITMPVKKDDYYKITSTFNVKIEFLPIGG